MSSRPLLREISLKFVISSADVKVMTKKSFNVLIVEDDSSQGAALLEAVKRAGYNAEWTKSPQQALALAHHTDFQLFIIDCMLPQKSGVDLIKDLKPHLSNSTEIFLISGVFKDRSFIREATVKSGAAQFFVKPLNLESVIAHINQTAIAYLEPDDDPVLGLYSGPTDQLEIWLNNHNHSFNNLHLPILLRRIQDAKCSGQLILNSGASSSISFYKGNVFEVKLTDSQSFFGILAVDKGYVGISEVEEALKSNGQKPIGQILIESLSLSPHAVNIILLEQVALRLSQLVQDQNSDLNWLPLNSKEPKIVLTKERLDNLVLEWLPSKFDETWLNETVMRWGNHKLKWLRSVNSDVANSLDEMNGPQSPTTPHELFEALFLGEAYIGEKISSNLEDSNIKQKYQRALQFFKGANHFQILGISEKARNAEIQRAYDLLTRSFSLPEQGKNISPDVSELAEKVFNVIKDSYNTLIDDTSRSAYIKDIQVKRHQAIIDLEPEFRAAILELRAGHFEQAAKRLDTLVAKKATFRDLKAYRIWAHLKTGDSINFEMEFDQIPPEGRYSAVYMFIRGLFYSGRLQHAKAVEYFKNAIVLDPKMTEAKFELSESEEALESTQHIRLVREVKGAIGSLLGKKKPKRSA